MEIQESIEIPHVEDINLMVTSILEKESKRNKKSDTDTETVELITSSTDNLLDLMIGFCSIGQDNLTTKENDLRKMISEELKNRAATNRL